jgi:putative transcriptional regulator
MINCLGKVLKKKKIYNRQIADFIGRSEGTVSLWVNNHRQPSLNELNQIAEYLRVDIRSLLCKSDWSKSTVEPAISKKKD